MDWFNLENVQPQDGERVVIYDRFRGPMVATYSAQSGEFELKPGLSVPALHWLALPARPRDLKPFFLHDSQRRRIMVDVHYPARGGWARMLVQPGNPPQPGTPRYRIRTIEYVTLSMDDYYDFLEGMPFDRRETFLAMCGQRSSEEHIRWLQDWAQDVSGN
ncbi:hypothetical protein HNR42_003592 [Deinobacterium chartae]|uniref:Uncharacterized protein n=1 Tax=Deinobacterium chartae TaxID=521158 RepID=A0A841I526_9DEIO|nr:hypothetical protein [Deinobacterium chartae]MBB6100126.1 hypothetical protein [Deinobacterium chartae]